MPAPRLRSHRTTGMKLEKAQDGQVDSAPAGHPSMQDDEHKTANHTARKRNISEALSDSEGNVLTKKLQTSTPKKKGTRQCRKRQASASPVTPPKGPRKRTNQRPGLIGKKTRRTKTEVAQEKAAKEAKAKELEETHAAAIAHLAVMDVDQERSEAEQHHRIICRQPSVFDVTANNDGEEFDLGSSGESDEMEVDDSDPTLPDNPVAAPRQTKPPKAKREMLTQVAKQVKKIKEGNSRRDGKKRNAAAPLPLASGLKDNWKRKAKSNGDPVQDATILGGLNDDHASAVRPKFEKQKASKASAAASLVKEVVGEVSDNSEIDIPQLVQTKLSKTKKGKGAGQGTRQKSLPIENSPTGPTMLTNTKTIAKTSKLKAVIVPKATNPANVIKSEAVQSPSALAAQFSSAKKLTDLPLSFRNSKSIEKFRATCYHGWMSSSDPFDGFSLESPHLLKIVCDAFSETFPDVEYVPVPRDIFHQTIYGNIQVQRSLIASQAIKDVTIFLSNQSNEGVKDWAEWTRAARLGELVYSEPCPYGCSLDKNAPNFKKPKGLFMTLFVRKLASPYLEYMNHSLIDYGHPNGLMALILVALERTVRAFEDSGEYKYPGPFNSSYKALFMEYLESAKDFTKWTGFYRACKFAPNDVSDEAHAAGVSQIDIGRRALNFSSSPVRA